jgi:hypothetical protein
VSAKAVTRCDCVDPYDIAACTDGVAAQMDGAEQWDPAIFEPGPYVRGVGDGPDE